MMRRTKEKNGKTRGDANETEFGAAAADVDFINPLGDTFDLEGGLGAQNENATSTAFESETAAEEWGQQDRTGSKHSRGPHAVRPAVSEASPTEDSTDLRIDTSGISSDLTETLLGPPAAVDPMYLDQGTRGHGSFRAAQSIDMTPQQGHDPNVGDPDALTDDELSDLAFAFQACDSDEDGWLEKEELRAMIAALVLILLL